MILGSPAKVVRELAPEQAARMGMGAHGLRAQLAAVQGGD